MSVEEHVGPVRILCDVLFLPTLLPPLSHWKKAKRCRNTNEKVILPEVGIIQSLLLMDVRYAGA